MLAQWLILLTKFHLLSNRVTAHSWVECTDYQGEITGQDWDEDNCAGFPRDWSTTSQFEWPKENTKVNNLNRSIGVNFCNNLFTLDGIENDYTNDYPFATYTVGNTYRIVWPAKNHANYECQNFVTDTGIRLYINPTPNSNTYPDNINEYNLLIDWHAEAENNGYEFSYNSQGEKIGIDGIPFQNCPDFCTDTNAAACFGDFTLSQDIFETVFNGTVGIYTFVWYWEFTSSSDIYTTCWEANVTNPITNPPTASPLDPPQPPILVTDAPASDPAIQPTEVPTESPTITIYTVTIPICYTRGNGLFWVGFDSVAFDAAFSSIKSLLESVDVYVNFTRISSFENDLENAWNASVITNELYDGEELLISLIAGNGTICNEIESETNDGGSCTTCGGAQITSYSIIIDNGNNRDSDDSGGGGNNNKNDSELILYLMLALGGVTVLLLIILFCFCYNKCCKKKERQNSIDNNVDSIGTLGSIGKIGKEFDINSQIKTKNSMAARQSNIEAVLDSNTNSGYNSGYTSNGSSAWSSPYQGSGNNNNNNNNGGGGVIPWNSVQKHGAAAPPPVPNGPPRPPRPPQHPGYY